MIVFSAYLKVFFSISIYFSSGRTIVFGNSLLELLLLDEEPADNVLDTKVVAG